VAIWCGALTNLFALVVVVATGWCGTISKAEALQSHHPIVMREMASKNISKRKATSGALALARQVRQFPSSKMWLDYDEEADVLYISLKRPQRATETIDLDQKGILLHYRNKDLVGITVLDASHRNGKNRS